MLIKIKSRIVLEIEYFPVAQSIEETHNVSLKIGSDGRGWTVDRCITCAGQVSVEPNNNPLQKQNLRISNCLLSWKDHQDNILIKQSKAYYSYFKKGEQHVDSLNKI